jgi:glycosyltransferase involved in cell wall biosynthesis
MRYLVVTEFWFGDLPGGAPRVAYDIARVMRDRGHQVSILCYHAGNDAPDGRSQVDGIEVVRFRKTQLPSWHPRRLQAIVDAGAAACRRWLNAAPFDLLHVHTHLIGLGAISALTHLWGRQPRCVFTVHSPLVLEQEIVWRSQGWAGQLKMLLGGRLLASVERRMLAAAESIHTLSEFTRARLDEAYEVGPRVTVIPHWYSRINKGVSRAEARCALGWPEKSRIFFTVRGMGPRRGLHVAIRALAPLLKDHDGYFFMAGDGQLRRKLETLALRLDSEHRIRFMGRISDKHLELAYAAADLFVLPTLALECFGLVTPEAFAFGCPVLSTDAGAIPEVMKPVLPQMMVRAGDEQALRDKARDFLNGTLSLPNGQVLVDYASRRYGSTVVIPQLCRLLESSGCI